MYFLFGYYIQNASNGGYSIKQEFIEKYYLGKEVELDIGGNNTYKGIVAECKDGVLSLKWTIKNEGYTHIDIEKIAAMWIILK